MSFLKNVVAGHDLELFHTSPHKINTIHDNGLFGTFLAFSTKPYYMTADPSSAYVYKITLPKDDIIEAAVLFHRDYEGKLNGIVTEVMEKFNLDEDTATDLLSEKKQLNSTDAEDDWWLQRKTAECAQELGYIACQMIDEQGTVYFVDAKKVKLKEVQS